MKQDNASIPLLSAGKEGEVVLGYVLENFEK